MFQKLLNSLYGKWYRPLIFTLVLNSLYFFSIFIFTSFKPINEIHNFRNISYLSMTILFVLIGIIHIFKSNKKFKEIIIVLGTLVVLVSSLFILKPYSSKAISIGNKNYISNKFENTCINASSGIDLNNKMYKLINEANNTTFLYKTIKTVSPTSKLLQENNVPYLYLNVLNNKIPYVCFWDKIENKANYLISQNDKTFGSLDRQRNTPTIYDNEILLVLKKDKSSVNGTPKNEIKKIETKQPTKEDFIKGAKSNLKKSLRSYASKSITDEEFEKLIEKFQIERCIVYSSTYDKELDVYKSKSSCRIKNSQKDIYNNVYLTYKDNNWVTPDNDDTLHCLVTKEKNTLAAWKAYMNKFPNGKCKEIAEKRIKEFSFLNPLVFTIKTDKNLDSFKLSNNEKLIAVSHNKQIDIYSIEEKKIISTIKIDFYKPKISFNKNDDILFVSAHDKKGKLFSLSNGKEKKLKYKLPNKIGFIFDDTLIFQYSDVHDVKSKSKKLHIGQYDLNTGKKIREKKFLKNKSIDIEEFRFSHNGRYLAIGLDGKKDSIILWDNKSWKTLWEKTITNTYYKNYIKFDFTADSNYLIHHSLDEDYYKILDINTGKLKKKIKYDYNFAVSNNLDRYLHTSYSRYVYISDTKTNKIIQSMQLKGIINSTNKIKLSFRNSDGLMISKYQNRIDFWKEISN